MVGVGIRLDLDQKGPGHPAQGAWEEARGRERCVAPGLLRFGSLWMGRPAGKGHEQGE